MNAKALGPRSPMPSHSQRSRMEKHTLERGTALGSIARERLPRPPITSEASVRVSSSSPGLLLGNALHVRPPSRRDRKSQHQGANVMANAVRTTEWQSQVEGITTPTRSRGPQCSAQQRAPAAGIHRGHSVCAPEKLPTGSRREHQQRDQEAGTNEELLTSP